MTGCVMSVDSIGHQDVRPKAREKVCRRASGRCLDLEARYPFLPTKIFRPKDALKLDCFCWLYGYVCVFERLLFYKPTAMERQVWETCQVLATWQRLDAAMALLLVSIYSPEI